MDIVILPPVLPGELDLQVINRRLRSGEVTLDWSQVKEAPESYLAVLLAGLDMGAAGAVPSSICVSTFFVSAISA